MSEQPEQTESIINYQALSRELQSVIDRLRLDLKEQVSINKRLQEDHRDHASIREYLKALTPLHTACGQLADDVLAMISAAPKDAIKAKAVEDLEIRANHVKRHIGILGQR